MPLGRRGFLRLCHLETRPERPAQDSALQPDDRRTVQPAAFQFLAQVRCIFPDNVAVGKGMRVAAPQRLAVGFGFPAYTLIVAQQALVAQGGQAHGFHTQGFDGRVLRLASKPALQGNRPAPVVRATGC